MDEALFRWINNWPDAWSPFFMFLSNATRGWPTRIALAALLIGMLWRPGTRRLAILAMLTWPVANGATDLFKHFLPQLRPCVELTGVHARIFLDSFGTASAHSANMAAVASCFVRGKSRWAPFWIAVALLTGISRAYVGVHYPRQIVLGWFVGIAVAYLVGMLVDRYWPAKPTPEVDPPAEPA